MCREQKGSSRSLDGGKIHRPDRQRDSEDLSGGQGLGERDDPENGTRDDEQPEDRDDDADRTGRQRPVVREDADREREAGGVCVDRPVVRERDWTTGVSVAATTPVATITSIPFEINSTTVLGISAVATFASGATRLYASSASSAQKR